MNKNVIMVGVLAVALFACSKTESGTASQETNRGGAKILVSSNASAPAASTPVTPVKIPLAISSKSPGFDHAKPNQILDIPIKITNKSDIVYNDPTNISYHFFDANGKEILHDGDRTAVSLPILPDAESEQSVRVYAPKEPGAYVIQIDLVKEGQYWFGDKGMAQVRLPVDVKNPN